MAILVLTHLAVLMELFCMMANGSQLVHKTMVLLILVMSLTTHLKKLSFVRTNTSLEISINEP